MPISIQELLQTIVKVSPVSLSDPYQIAILLISSLAGFLVAHFIITRLANRPSPFLKPLPSKDQQWKFVPLSEKIHISDDSTKFVFSLPHNKFLNIPVGRHLQIANTLEKDALGQSTVQLRSYTPVSPPTTLGSFELVIKKYPLGKVSPFIHSLEIGDMLPIRGPRGHYTHQPNRFKHICMMGGGSGITPLLSVLLETLSDPTENTTISLLYSNKTEDDILCNEEITEMADNFSSFSYFCTLTRTKSWSSPMTDANQSKNNNKFGLLGRINLDMIKNATNAHNIDITSEESVGFFVCGPKGFVKACRSLVQDSASIQSSKKNLVIF